MLLTPYVSIPKTGRNIAWGSHVTQSEGFPASDLWSSAADIVTHFFIQQDYL